MTFNIEEFQHVAGFLLGCACYVAAPAFLMASVSKEVKDGENFTVLFMIGFVLLILSHLISAGVIK